MKQHRRFHRIKLSTLILAAILFLFVASIFASNIILKREYDRTDKNDMYWNYGTILKKPFKHLVIEGDNISYSNYRGYVIGNVVFEQGNISSVRVPKGWVGYEKGSIKAAVKNDTLFVKFPDEKSFGNNDQFRYETLVRIFSPELLSVDGINTSMKLLKLDQKNLIINTSAGSKIQVESLVPNMDGLTINQKDSSDVRFILSPKYAGKERMKVNTVNADLMGTSLLDMGSAEIQSLHLDISDSSSIVLSGKALKEVRK